MHIIYSFHMPIFIVVSGFLFYKSIVKYDFKTLLLKKSLSTLVPITFFGLVWFCLKVFFHEIEINSLFRFVYHIGGAVITNLWFLWILFFCFITVLLIHKYLRDNILIFIIIPIVGLFVPNFLLSSYFFFLFPFFSIGYLFCKYNLVDTNMNLSIKVWLFIFIIALIFWCLLLLQYNHDTFIYTTRYSLISSSGISFYQLIVDCHRFFAGLFGCIAIISLFSTFSIIVKNCKLLLFLGKNSLPIYIFSTYLFLYFLPLVTYDFKGGNIILWIFESVIIILICLLLKYFFSLTKFGYFLLYGNYKKKEMDRKKKV